MVKKGKSKKAVKKGFWDKLSYWQRGGFVGLFIGIIFNIYIYTFNEGLYLKDGIASWQAFPNILPLMFHSISFSSAISNPIDITSALFILIWYGILGSLLGLVYKFVKQKYPKKLTLIFIIALIIFIVLILLLNFLILIGLFSIYT